MSSGLRKPLDTMVGVQRTSRSLRRTVMLPSLAAAKPLAYKRRPISQICCFSWCSFMSKASLAVQVVYQAGNHFLYFDDVRGELGMFARRKKTQIVCEQQLVLQLAAGSHCDRQCLTKF